MYVSTGWVGYAAIRYRISGQITCLHILALTATGCQTGGATVSNRILIAHLPGIDFDGASMPMEPVDTVKVDCSLPNNWKPLRLDRTCALHASTMRNRQSAQPGPLYDALQPSFRCST